MLWTTSRYASDATKKEARRLAAREGSRFAARGKKTIAQLADYARKSGEGRIMVLEEKAGKPFRVSSIEVLGTGKWRWAGKEGLDEHGHAVKRKD